MSELNLYVTPSGSGSNGGTSETVKWTGTATWTEGGHLTKSGGTAFPADAVGHFVYLDDPSWPVWSKVTARNSDDDLTLADAAMMEAELTATIGGAFSKLSEAGTCLNSMMSFSYTSMNIYVQTGITDNDSGGFAPISWPAKQGRIIGYVSTPGDGGRAAITRAAGGDYIQITGSGLCTIRGLDMASSWSGGSAISGSADRLLIDNCRFAHNAYGLGAVYLSSAGNATIIRGCEFASCSYAVMANRLVTFSRCLFAGNTHNTYGGPIVLIDCYVSAGDFGSPWRLIAVNTTITSSASPLISNSGEEWVELYDSAVKTAVGTGVIGLFDQVATDVTQSTYSDAEMLPLSDAEMRAGCFSATVTKKPSPPPDTTMDHPDPDLDGTARIAGVYQEVGGGGGDYPDEADVRDGVSYDDGLEGTLDLPDVGDVRQGVNYDGGSKIGTLVIPTRSALDGFGRTATMYKPGDSYYGTFVTRNPATGAPADANSLPAATAVHNGVDDAGFSLTVTNVETGRYKITGTVPSTYAAGDAVQIVVDATVDSTAAKMVVDSFLVEDTLAVAGAVDDEGPGADEFTAAAGLSSDDDAYTGMVCVFVSGDLAGISRVITDYAGSTRTFSFETAFPAAPAEGDRFYVVGWSGV